MQASQYSFHRPSPGPLPPSFRPSTHPASLLLLCLLTPVCPNWTNAGGQLGGWFTLTVDPGRTVPCLHVPLLSSAEGSPVFPAVQLCGTPIGKSLAPTMGLFAQHYLLNLLQASLSSYLPSCLVPRRALSVESLGQPDKCREQD